MDLKYYKMNPNNYYRFLLPGPDFLGASYGMTDFTVKLWSETMKISSSKSSKVGWILLIQADGSLDNKTEENKDSIYAIVQDLWLKMYEMEILQH
jgi:hypothetical protein